MRTPHFLFSALSMVAGVVATTGCGGGSGSSNVTVTILSTQAVDGMITDGGAVFPTFDLQVGDTITNNSKRGFLRFSHAAIPVGTTIVAATLRVHQSIVFSTPYTAFGDVFVDHIDIGALLDASDFASVAILTNFGILSSDATLGYKSLDVTGRVVADVAAARLNSDFRLHTLIFTDADGVVDSSHWNDGDDAFASGNVPQLFVTYTP